MYLNAWLKITIVNNLAIYSILRMIRNYLYIANSRRISLLWIRLWIEFLKLIWLLINLNLHFQNLAYNSSKLEICWYNCFFALVFGGFIIRRDMIFFDRNWFEILHLISLHYNNDKYILSKAK